MVNLVLGDTKLIIEEAKKAGLLRNQLAYVLATAYHETAHTMKPVREYGGETYLKKKKYYPYVGMGYVQLTWKENYEKAGKILGVDFVSNPKLLLEPKYSAVIIVVGMKEGWFAGDQKGRHKLDRYITLQKSDFRQARKMINGMDKADLIAGYAVEYDKLLKAAGYGVETTDKLISDVLAPEADVVAQISEPAKVASIEATTSILNLAMRLFNMWRKK